MCYVCKTENWYKPLVDCVSVKAPIFWESQANLKNSPTLFWSYLLTNVKEKWKTFSKFGGLLRIVYESKSSVSVSSHNWICNFSNFQCRKTFLLLLIRPVLSIYSFQNWFRQKLKIVRNHLLIVSYLKLVSSHTSFFFEYSFKSKFPAEFAIFKISNAVQFLC